MAAIQKELENILQDITKLLPQRDEARKARIDIAQKYDLDSQQEPLSYSKYSGWIYTSPLRSKQPIIVEDPKKAMPKEVNVPYTYRSKKKKGLHESTSSKTISDEKTIRQKGPYRGSPDLASITNVQEIIKMLNEKKENHNVALRERFETLKSKGISRYDFLSINWKLYKKPSNQMVWETIVKHGKALPTKPYLAPYVVFDSKEGGNEALQSPVADNINTPQNNSEEKLFSPWHAVMEFKKVIVKVEDKIYTLLLTHIYWRVSSYDDQYHDQSNGEMDDKEELKY